MNRKLFFKPTIAKVIAPIFFALFLLLVFTMHLFASFLSEYAFVLIIMSAYWLTIPFAPLLGILDLWTSTTWMDSPGPTSGGFALSMVFWILLSYLLGCVISYFFKKKK